jgi:hypothetical protein
LRKRDQIWQIKAKNLLAPEPQNPIEKGCTMSAPVGEFHVHLVIDDHCVRAQHLSCGTYFYSVYDFITVAITGERPTDDHAYASTFWSRLQKKKFKECASLFGMVRNLESFKNNWREFEPGDLAKFEVTPCVPILGLQILLFELSSKIGHDVAHHILQQLNEVINKEHKLVAY